MPTRQFGQKLAHVVSNVHVFREALDDVIAFGERCSALEDKVRTIKRRKQRTDRPDDLDILFEEMQRSTGLRSSDAQGIELVTSREPHKLITHEPPAPRQWTWQASWEAPGAPLQAPGLANVGAFASGSSGLQVPAVLQAIPAREPPVPPRPASP